MTKASWVGMWTLMRRETWRFMRLWTQTIIPPMITAVLYILIFGYSLGSRITDIQGVTYLEFIIPGLMMMNVLTSAYSNTSSSLFISKFQKNIEELLVAPMTYWQIITAVTTAGVLRGLCVGAGILAVSALFANIMVHNIFVLVFFILMVALLFSFAGICVALWADNFDKLTVFTTFLITPLTYLGGVFYSIHMLPVFWQGVSRFNPILYMIDGFRYGFIGVSDVPLIHSILVLTVLTLGFFALCVHLFRIGYKLRT